MSEDRGAYVSEDSDDFEALDEDNIKHDPLETEPEEGWAESDKYGMTEYEQAHPRPLDERLAEERPEERPEERGEDDETGA
ncbi:hypothetical protein UK23_30340 [Lentzea aerocolonigenes]|uniref:Uncharacterized protein n=1 Tax=Lentzea aerocolonigenes TaxID=68170 RepID=A0A0F0GQG7_LENAE|nr:hypothetical protein [Lentzea aerocolonigenes]KJK44197.1 hypothetical protein UK23_30340 [Lentzea aerocolonigenes]